jgi:hypothetical protein
VVSTTHTRPCYFTAKVKVGIKEAFKICVHCCHDEAKLGRQMILPNYFAEKGRIFSSDAISAINSPA